MYKIVKKEVLNDVVELMEVHAPYVAKKCEPGQFIILRVGEDGERIPLTIADFDREKETITIIYQIVGYSTKELAKLNEGDELTDFVGPLGVPTVLHEAKHVIEMCIRDRFILERINKFYGLIYAKPSVCFCANSTTPAGTIVIN